MNETSNSNYRIYYHIPKSSILKEKGSKEYKYTTAPFFFKPGKYFVY